MPKKGNKGKGKGKGKGKKESKDSKADKESEMEKYKANADLWEVKFTVTEIARVEYREATRTLAKANEELENQQYRAEKDTRDIIGFLKKTDQEKTVRIAALEEQLKREKARSSHEKDTLVSQYMEQVEALDEKFKQRSSDFKRMQEDLKTIKHFRQIKATLEEDLTSMREKIVIADRAHQESLTRAECKFYISRIHLEKEAEKKISQLSDEAHHEAVVQLSTVSQSVFKENIRLSDALSYHVKQAEELKRRNMDLTEKNNSLSLLKETNELMGKEADFQLNSTQDEITELRAEQSTLEHALDILSREFQKNREETEQLAFHNIQHNYKEIEDLEKLLALREKELSHVKRVAQSIIEQRKELDFFFHEALDYVRKQARAQQQKYRQEALKAYRWKMNEAHAGRCEFPPIQTFCTNDVQTDLQEAEKWNKLKKSSSVDISDLSWEQKERLLTMLFAKLNGHKIRKPGAPPPLIASSSERIHASTNRESIEQDLSLTFLTQMPTESMNNDHFSLPALKMTMPLVGTNKLSF